MNRTTARMTRAAVESVSFPQLEPAIMSNATITPSTAVRYMPTRAKAAYQASDREDSSDQCSVERICIRNTVGWGAGPESAWSLMASPGKGPAHDAQLEHRGQVVARCPVL